MKNQKNEDYECKGSCNSKRNNGTHLTNSKLSILISYALFLYFMLYAYNHFYFYFSRLTIIQMLINQTYHCNPSIIASG